MSATVMATVDDFEKWSDDSSNIDDASRDSFPASDPPGWWAGPDRLPVDSAPVA